MGFFSGLFTRRNYKPDWSFNTRTRIVNKNLAKFAKSVNSNSKMLLKPGLGMGIADAVKNKRNLNKRNLNKLINLLEVMPDPKPLMDRQPITENNWESRLKKILERGR